MTNSNSSIGSELVLVEMLKVSRLCHLMSKRIHKIDLTVWRVGEKEKMTDGARKSLASPRPFLLHSASTREQLEAHLDHLIPQPFMLLPSTPLTLTFIRPIAY